MAFVRTVIVVLMVGLLVACSSNAPQGATSPTPTTSPSEAAEHTVVQIGNVSCNPNVVHNGDAKDGVGIPWLYSASQGSEVFAHLFYYQQGDPAYAAMPTHADASTAPKILWVFRGPSAGASMDLSMTKRGATASPKQSFKAAGFGSFPSLVGIPTPGCWDLQVQSGTTSATFTMVVVSS